MNGSQEKALLTRTRSRQRYMAVHTQQIIAWLMLVKHHLSRSADSQGVSLHK
jgi:hypothetical protein